MSKITFKIKFIPQSFFPTFSVLTRRVKKHASISKRTLKSMTNSLLRMWRISLRLIHIGTWWIFSINSWMESLRDSFKSHKKKIFPLMISMLNTEHGWSTFCLTFLIIWRNTRERAGREDQARGRRGRAALCWSNICRRRESFMLVTTPGTSTLPWDTGTTFLDEIFFRNSKCVN